MCLLPRTSPAVLNKLTPSSFRFEIKYSDIPARQQLERLVNLFLKIKLGTRFAERFEPRRKNEVGHGDPIYFISVTVTLARVTYFIGIQLALLWIALYKYRE